MVLDSAAGGVLVCGAAGCAAAAILRRRSRPASLLLAAALACAAAGELGGEDWLGIAACARAAGGAGALVESRFGPPLAMSWLDAAMGATSVGALAVALGADAGGAVAAAGIAATPALARWRFSPALVGVLTGIAVLGVDGSGAAIAAPLFLGA